jgi:hypothetical protein
MSLWIKHVHKLTCDLDKIASQSEHIFVKKTGKVQIEKYILSDSQVRNFPVGGARTDKFGPLPEQLFGD